MAAKKRGLGRGLDALLGAGAAPIGEPVAPVGIRAPGPAAPADDAGLLRLPVEFIRRSRYQPRRSFDEDALQDLADSIRAQGVMQPLVVRPLPEEPNAYELIAGERRWRASQMAGLGEVPCLVREVTDQAALAMALIENIQREDLSPVEEALALQRLQQEFSLTHEEISEVVGKSRATVTNLLRLLNLQPGARDLLDQGRIEMGHARALLAIDGAAQSELAEMVAQRGLSVRETERLVRDRQADHENKRKKKAAPALDPDVQRLQDAISDSLGAPARIEAGKGRGGRLVIQYSSPEELDGILRNLGVQEPG